MKEILRTTIRLYAEKPADREALRLLRQVREEQHCAMRMLSWRRSMRTMGKRGKPASIIVSGRKSAALFARRWQHLCFDALSKQRQRH